MQNLEDDICNFDSLTTLATQRETLVLFARHVFATKGRALTQKDLESYQISSNVVNRLGGLESLLSLAGIASNKRKPNMTDEQLKIHISNLAKSSVSCPSYQKSGTVCHIKCSCWETNALCKTKDGRVKFFYKKKTRFLYQIVYLLYHGPINKGFAILHLCDNPCCFNPEHLIQGTAKENAQHCKKRGRRASLAGRKQQKVRHTLTNPRDLNALLVWIKSNSVTSDRQEWLYTGSLDGCGYARINIGRKNYKLHRLLLSNLLGLAYKDVNTASHRFPHNSPFAGQKPLKHDLNPDHLFNGTVSSNTNDTKEYHKGYSLSREQVLFILDEAQKTDFTTNRAIDFDMRIANTLSVTAKIVKGVRTGRTYKNWHSIAAVSAKTRAVVQLSMQKEFIASYASASQAARALDQNTPSGISMACNGKIKSSAGYIWMHEARYIEWLSSNSSGVLNGDTSVVASDKEIQCKI